MSHIILRRWEEFRSNIEQSSADVIRERLIMLLIELNQNIKMSDDVEVRVMYDRFLKYFEAINVHDYLIIEQPWYSLKDIISFDIINCKIDSLNRVMVKIRDLLWMLLVFKTDQQCSRCDEDEMRVLSAKDRSDIYLCCDSCGLVTDMNGVPVSAPEVLYPLTYQKIVEAGFNPSNS